jgi:hypothetical protein
MMSQLIKWHFLMEVRVVEDEKKNCLLNHFNSCKKSGDDSLQKFNSFLKYLRTSPGFQLKLTF